MLRIKICTKSTSCGYMHSTMYVIYVICTSEIVMGVQVESSILCSYSNSLLTCLLKLIYFYFRFVFYYEV